MNHCSLFLSFSSTILSTCLSFAQAYNQVDCESWPSAELWDELASHVTALHGPFEEEFYPNACETLGTDAYAISQAGNGICMHAHACQYEFCRTTFAADLPAYIVEAKSEADIQASLAFCREHEIAVTIKTTGHSYHGASTAKHSLLIWMQNYPKDGQILKDYTPAGCDGAAAAAAEVHDAVIAINGGETWNDVIEAVGPNYHVVTGGGRTVSAVGGWLQGSGLSFSSRQYGLGVDQVVDFRVILANGTIAVASACENQDLFWALRGGGGGTWGVVTQAHYKLHPLTPITTTDWFIQGFENAPLESQLKSVELWLKFWTETSPTLDFRCGGYFNAGGVSLVFAGTREEAEAAYLNGFETWYYTVLLPEAGFIEGLFGALPPSLVTTQVDSWYTYKGGPDAYNNPDATDPTGDAYQSVEFIDGILMPLDTVQSDPNGASGLLYDLAINLELGSINYFLGGAVSEVQVSETSVSAALRGAIWNLFPSGEAAGKKVRDFVPQDRYGACFNHHSPTEVNWRESLWGLDTYNDLLAIKEKYDSNHVFNCWHCVGYVGDENPVIEGESPFENACPSEEEEEDGDGSSAKSNRNESRVSFLSGLAVLLLSTVITIG